MTLRLAILTTDTPHHRYFLRRLANELPAGAAIVLNVFEEKPYPWARKAREHFVKNLPNLWRGLVLNPYIQSKKLALKQLALEKDRFFPDGDRSVPAGFPTARVHSVNDERTAALLGSASPDLLLVYGTGKILPRVFECIPRGAINAHGGLLPDYRGLDTNLWAAFEGKPEDMAVTIHQIDASLDTGSIFMVCRIGRIRSLDLINLRYHTTLICTDLFLEVIRQAIKGTLVAEPQLGKGRYFGPMPMVLKRRAEKNIRRYVAAV